MKKIKVLVSGILFLMGLAACGKITQIPLTLEENKSFDLAYSVDIVPTESIKVQGQYKTAELVVSAFTTADQAVYARVIGFKKTGRQQEELSWGKGALLPALKTSNATMNAGIRRKFISQSFRKDGIEMTQSDHTWTKLELDPAQLIWRGVSKKVERNYPLYMVCVYSKDKLAFKTVSEASVTGNKAIELGTITPYDTFISILCLINWEESGELGDAEAVEKLKQLYPPSFFAQLGYTPKNYAKRFDPASPVFVWEGKLEKNLIKILYLTRKSKPVALTFIQQLSSDIMPDKAKESLVQVIQKLP